MKVAEWVALVLVIVGALNWGLVGIAGIDLVAAICGAMTLLSRTVYVLVGLAAIWIAVISPRLMK